jgi:hypothetical protein
MTLLLRFALQLLQQVVEAFVAVLPDLAITADPFRDLLQPSGFEPARPALRVAPACDQPGTLQHLKMLRNGWLTHVEWRRQLEHRGLPFDKAREDGSPRSIREGGKSGIQIAFREGGYGHLS